MTIRANNLRFSVLLAALLAVTGCSANFYARKTMELQAAQDLYAAGDYINAAAGFDRIIATHPGAAVEARAYLGLGLSYERMNDYGDALINYRIAVQLYPKDISLMLSLASLYDRLKLFPQALEVYNKALDKDGDNLRANVGIAKTYMSLGYLGLAAQHYEAALENEENPDLRIRMAYIECLYRQRRYQEAEDAMAKALPLGQANAALWLLLAEIQYDRGFRNRAIDSIRRASEISGGRLDIEVRRALWLSTDGSLDDALALARRLRVEYPNDPLVCWTLGMVLLKADKPEEAGRYMKEAASYDARTFISSSAKKIIGYIADAKK
ncbi:MAG: tetratricopeptide repeat protein [Elusimicrobiaceae bacterium]